MRTATVSAETTVIHHTGRGLRLRPGTYDVAELDGVDDRKELYLFDSGNGELLRANPNDPNLTVNGGR